MSTIQPQLSQNAIYRTLLRVIDTTARFPKLYLQDKELVETTFEDVVERLRLGTYYIPTNPGWVTCSR